MPTPSTATLDAFTRANNPTSLGANYLAGIESGYSSMGVINNQAYLSASWQDAYWASQFAADQEVGVTVAALPSYSFRLVARLQNPGGGTVNFVSLNLASTGALSLNKVVAGAGSWLGDMDPIVAGDKICLQAEGTTVRGFIYHAGAWNAPDVYEVTGVTDVAGAGYIGMGGGDEGGGGGLLLRVDDFFGGAINVAPPLDTCLPDADIATTGWSTAPLFSKVNDASDATVITATAS